MRIIEEEAFYGCEQLTYVEFGDKLETIGGNAFAYTDLRNIKLPRVSAIGKHAFCFCQQLTDMDFSEDLGRIGYGAFEYCFRLRRIDMPLKSNLLADHVCYDCRELSRVDLVGGIHKTVSSLLLDSWRNEMNDEINRINQDLPNINERWNNAMNEKMRGHLGPINPLHLNRIFSDLPNINHNEKTVKIQQWMERVMRRIEHYKSEHRELLKEFTTLRELALWKAKLDENQHEWSLGRDQPANIARIDIKAERTRRQKQRITSGASIVIKNVLTFLKLE